MSNFRLIYAASVIKAANALEHLLAAAERQEKMSDDVTKDVTQKAVETWTKALNIVKDGVGSFSKEVPAIDQINACFTEMRRERSVALKARNERRAAMAAERADIQALFGTAA